MPLYSAEIADSILDRMMGGESLRRTCGDSNMPSFQSVLKWVREDKEGFAMRYADAVDVRAQCLAEDLLELSRSALGVATGAPGTGEAGARVAAVRLQVDTLKWTLARMAPKRFGEKVTTEITGSDGGPVREVQKISVELVDAILARTAAAAAIALQVQPPANFRGMEHTA